jgi:tRNA(Ile2) C34 agmatinyltransferase TiaS
LCFDGDITRMDRVNTVQMVGEVRERPFRPGEGNRVVVKVRVHDDETGRFDNVEFDSFGQVGDFAIRLFTGDRIAVRGRLEGRVFDDGDEVKVVANHVELVRRASDAPAKDRQHHDDRHDDRHDEHDDLDD